MTNVIIKKSIVATVLITILLVILLGFNTTLAEESPYLDLENDVDATFSYEEIQSKKGMILNTEVIKNNSKAIDKYLEQQKGEIIIPNRKPGKVLGWRLKDIEGENLIVEPFYLYNSEIDKTQINYMEEFTTRETVDLATDFLSGTISFSVYGTDWFSRVGLVAHVYIYMSIDYYDLNNPNYSYYIGKYEVAVVPYDGRVKVESFKMCLMQYSDGSKDLDQQVITTNNMQGTESVGGNIQVGMKNADGSIEGQITTSYNYNFSVPDRTSQMQGPVINRYDQDYIYNTYKVSPADKANYGDSYSGLILMQYRMPAGQTFGGAGIAFRELGLKSKINNPGYDVKNADSAIMFAGWEYPFINKSMMMVVGKMSDLEGGDNSKQYFEDLTETCSLPKRTTLGGIIMYEEN